MLFNGKENYITAIEILLWSIEYALDIKIFDEDNYCYFPNIYNINMQKKLSHMTMMVVYILFATLLILIMLLR